MVVEVMQWLLCIFHLPFHFCLLSDFFFDSKATAASIPTTYLKFGLSDVTAHAFPESG
jgi:hypothetical protein